jgi:hypothetical protein
MVRYPELLTGTRIMPLANGAHARHLTMLCRDNELGDIPLKMSEYCRSIYGEKIVPQLTEIAPWLDRQAYPINEMPLI